MKDRAQIADELHLALNRLPLVEFPGRGRIERHHCRRTPFVPVRRAPKAVFRKEFLLCDDQIGCKRKQALRIDLRAPQLGERVKRRLIARLDPIRRIVLRGRDRDDPLRHAEIQQGL